MVWVSDRKRVPAVALLGSRQIGKTTLARLVSEDRLTIYLDLESPRDLVRLDDSVAFLSQHADNFIVLDEIQRKLNLFTVLRGIIDENRYAGKKGEQFLLLSSASMDLLRQSSESLAGRIHYIEMSGLNILEIKYNALSDLRRLWLRGGFPDSYLMASKIILIQFNLSIKQRTLIDGFHNNKPQTVKIISRRVAMNANKVGCRACRSSGNKQRQ